MILFQTKYQQLIPIDGFLKGMVVLARAWKKTHTAIRRYNWYADVLGADCSLEVLRVLKNSELRQFGEYRTRCLVLAAWDQQAANGVFP